MSIEILKNIYFIACQKEFVRQLKLKSFLPDKLQFFTLLYELHNKNANYKENNLFK
jgi:hypothetical protein